MTLADFEAEQTKQFGPHSVYPSWIIFSLCILAVGFGTFVTQALFLSAISGKGCTLFTAVAAIFLIIGLILCAVGIVTLCFRAIQPKVTEPATCGQLTGRIIFFVLMTLLSGICFFMMVAGGAVWRMKRNQAALNLDFSGAPGISADITISRDTGGIPHISASTMEDGFFAMGFIAAQDRIFQIEGLRLFAYGRLSELAGDSALDVDKTIRSLGVLQMAQKVLDLMNSTQKVPFERYAAGINFFLEKDGALSPEFMFIGSSLFSYYEPEPFSLIDLLTMAVFVEYRLSGNRGEEKYRWQMFDEGQLTWEDIEGLWYSVHTNVSSILSAEQLGISEADAIAGRAAEATTQALEEQLYLETMGRFRDNQSYGTLITATSSHSFETQEEKQKDQQKRQARKEKKRRPSSTIRNRSWSSILHDPKAYIASILLHQYDKALTGGEAGSNAWFVRHAATGTIMGGGDPHLTAVIPQPWHAIQLHVAANNDSYSGMAIAGVPTVMYGRNNNLMWAVTVSRGDFSDYFFMEPDQNNLQTHYMYHGQSVAYVMRQETIKVKGTDDVTFTVEESVLGPIIGQYNQMSTNHKLAFNMTAVFGDAHRQVETMSALVNFFTASQVTEFYEYGKKVSAPGINFNAADSKGGLLYFPTGLLPKRKPGHTGRYPVIGNGSYDYDGYFYGEEIPFLLDLNYNQDGYTLSANQRITPDGFLSHTMAYDYHYPYRGERIRSMLETARDTDGGLNWTKQEFHEYIATDERSNIWLDHILPQLQSHGSNWTDLLASSTAGMEQWTKMQAWDGYVEVGSPEAYFLSQWTNELALLPANALAALEWSIFSSRHIIERLVMNPTAATDRLCRTYSETSGADQTCLDFLANRWNAMAVSANANPKKFGSEEYGATYAPHQIFGGSIFGCLTDSIIERGGDASSVSYADIESESDGHDLEKFYRSRVPNFRHLYSFNQTDGYHMTWLGGQSGHWFSKYFLNQGEDLSTNTYRFVEITTSPSNSETFQTLRP